MKSTKLSLSALSGLLIIILSIILLDYLPDGKFDTTYHLIQIGHNYLFRFNAENLLCVFHIYKQLTFGLGLIAKQLELNNLILIIFAKSLIEQHQQLINSLTQILHLNNFSNQYKNSLILHIDISQANIALP